MAKALLGISILILLFAAGLGFSMKPKVEAKVADLKDTKKTLGITQGALETKKKELIVANDNITALNSTVEDQKSKISAGETALNASKAETEKATADVKDRETQIAVLKDENDKLKNPVVGAPTENPAMIALQKQVEDANNQAKEAKIASEQFQARQKAAEEKVAGLEATIKHYQEPIRQAALTGNVLHVNQGWNFVVIDVGDKQGVTVNSPLLVMRGGVRVATLKITSVEPRQSIADVVPGSMARGTVVQVGDRVVFAGVRGQPSLPPPGPAGLDAPAPGSGTSAPAPAGLPH